jgi:hypothetical protein
VDTEEAVTLQSLIVMVMVSLTHIVTTTKETMDSLVQRMAARAIGQERSAKQQCAHAQAVGVAIKEQYTQLFTIATAMVLRIHIAWTRNEGIMVSFLPSQSNAHTLGLTLSVEAPP